MGVREFTDKAKELFTKSANYVTEVIKQSVTSSKVPWIVTAQANIGQTEISGKRSNPTIMSWAKRIGGWVKSYYKDDDIPWCGLFVAYCLQANNITITIKNPLSARAWLKFGEEIKPCFGAIMVFSRNGGGHVGFYVSEDANYYHILGGNQSNSVNVMKVAKSRFLGARWPTGYTTLYEKNKDKIIWKNFDGTVYGNNS